MAASYPAGEGLSMCHKMGGWRRPKHPLRRPPQTRRMPSRDQSESKFAIRGAAAFHDPTSHARALCKREQVGQAGRGSAHPLPAPNGMAYQPVGRAAV